MTIVCKQCGTEIVDDAANDCPSCGARLEKEQSSPPRDSPAALLGRAFQQVQEQRARADQGTAATTPGDDAAQAGGVAGHPMPGSRPKYCSNCGHALSLDAKFCEECGTPVGGVAPAPRTVSAPRWEYKDVTIDFPRGEFSNINTWNDRRFDAVVARGDEIILAKLREEGQEGWQAEGVTSFRELYREGLIQVHRGVTIRQSASKVTFIRTTIRLRRLVE